MKVNKSISNLAAQTAKAGRRDADATGESAPVDGSKGAAKATPTGGSVSVGAEIRKLSALVAGAPGEPSVADIKAAIANGTYKPDLAKLADNPALASEVEG